MMPPPSHRAPAESSSGIQARENTDVSPVWATAFDCVPNGSARILRRVDPEWNDCFKDRARESSCASVESLVWFVAESVALQFTPLASVLVRALYVGKQVFTAFDGMAEGEGFNLKLSVPGLDLLDGGVLPPGFQLGVSVRLGERLERRDGGFDVNAEIQVFKPWFDQIDIGKVQAPLEVGKSSGRFDLPTVVENTEQALPDPWAEWLALLGRRLVDDLPAVISQAPGLAFVMEISPREAA